MSLRSHIHIDSAALRHNVQQVQQWAGTRNIIAVVKADGYGLGAERVVPIYAEAGIRHYAVANINEAIRLRTIVPEARLVILGEVLAEERERVANIQAEPCVSRLEDVWAFARYGSEEQPLGLHCFVDTGMGRMGCLPGEAIGIISAIREHPRLRLTGIGTHYPEASDAAFSTRQEQQFAKLLAAIGPIPDDCLVHLANSDGLRLRPTDCGNSARVGLLLTGVCDDAEARERLLPAVSWHSCITLIKELPAGHPISYGMTYHLNNDTMVAIVPIGYADGYPTLLSHKASVLIHGKRCPVLGRVTMDYLVADISGLDHPHLSDEVIILGRQGEEHIRAEELAQMSGLLSYEILCSLNKRFREK
jgi:alanine racemase